MTHTLKNLSRRLVSLRGNSGQTWHIPPSTSIELPDFEAIENVKLRKLEERHLIGVVRPEAKQPKPGDEDQDRDRKPEPDDEDQDRGRKSRSKR